MTVGVRRCEPERAPLRVAVLLSGGVDSSLSLHLLLAAGHRPTAFYLQIWFQEDFHNFWTQCPWEDDLRVCRQVGPCHPWNPYPFIVFGAVSPASLQ